MIPQENSLVINGEKVTPVPIPNTEVKLLSADGSWDFVPVRVGRCQAVLYGGLAQLGEHLPYKQRVGGSIPSSSTIIFSHSENNLKYVPG